MNGEEKTTNYNYKLEGQPTTAGNEHRNHNLNNINSSNVTVHDKVGERNHNYKR